MKTAIIIDINRLRDLMKEFIAEVEVNSSRTHMEWTFETFLQWLRNKQKEQSNGKQEVSTLSRNPKASRFAER